MARISKIYRILISGLLALLGFSAGSCFLHAPEYGVPTATYKAKGVVVSEVGNTPIQGILAVLKYDRDNEYVMDTTFTNSNGSFSLESYAFPRQNQKLYVVLTDVDGEDNGGSFAMKVVEADFTNVTLTGGDGHWYAGEAEIDLGTITMTLASE